MYMCSVTHAAEYHISQKRVSYPAVTNNPNTQWITTTNDTFPDQIKQAY